MYDGHLNEMLLIVACAMMIKICYFRDAWVAQSVKRQTLDIIPGLDLRVVSLSPALGSTSNPENLGFQYCKNLINVFLAE